MMKNLVILGSTGSIGTQTLEIIRNNTGFHTYALAADKNVKLMEEEVREFSPEFAVMFDENAASELKVKISDTATKVLTGMDGLIEVVTLEPVDMVLTALVGMIGVRPTIAAIEAGKDIALANKETLVTAGHIIMPLVKEKGVKLLPVDSEHSAIFQSLNGEDHGKIEKILLTASGGPFFGKSYDELKGMTVADALKHPNWSMGRKITIDSASMVNKGLEVIEAKWLFDVPAEKIQVVVQRESVVHSMVEYVDGAVIAELGVPDMKLPIQYALYYPERLPMAGNKLDFWALKSLSFDAPDTKVFKGLPLAYRAINEGGIMPTVFNAANEYAVSKFLSGDILFTEIYDHIEASMDAIKNVPDPGLSDVLSAEAATYEFLKKR